MSLHWLSALAVVLLTVSGSALARAEGGNSAPFNPDAVPASVDSIGRGMGEVSRPRDRFIAIYSGSTRGTYFYVASAICAAIEAHFDEHRIRCVSLRSQGDAANVSLMNEGRAQFIIIQSNTNHAAASGRIELPSGRSVMSLHDELGVLVVARRSGIQRVSDLRGARINQGPEGSALRRLWEGMLKAEGIAPADLGAAYSATPDLNQRGLCDGYLDAFAMWIGHPAPPIAMSTVNCGAHIVGLRSPGIEKMVADAPYFFWGVLPANVYPGQKKPLESYGFKATLVADERVAPDLVYWLVRSVQQSLGVFRAGHPALAQVEPRPMFADANFLPFHQGAARYWRELGWLSDSAAK